MQIDQEKRKGASSSRSEELAEGHAAAVSEEVAKGPADEPEEQEVGYDLDGRPLLKGHGASAATVRGPNDPDFPLLVWLRGDEPYCGDFTLDADDVMERLGIKRSRLTQISGRELRVGRMRMGRYIRPVYRSEDVEAYKQWTRATASHVKAASVLQGAAKDLSESFSATVESLTQDVHVARDLQDEALKLQLALQKQLTDMQAALNVEFNERLQFLREQFQSQQRDLLYALHETVQQSQNHTAARLQTLELQLTTISPTVQLIPEMQKLAMQDTATKFAVLASEVAALSAELPPKAKARRATISRRRVLRASSMTPKVSEVKQRRPHKKPRRKMLRHG
jgi:hypothetical protein